MAHDLPASQRFYHELLGWEYDTDMQALGPYVRALKGGSPVAGLGNLAGRPPAPAAWLPYFAAEDADETAMLVRDCGGTLAVGPLDAGRAGRLAVAADPHGAAFGLWQAGKHLGQTFSAGSGTPVWTELLTVETAQSQTFYSMVLGHEARPEPLLPDADYLTLYIKDDRVAGIEAVDEQTLTERGAHWLTYFSVPDADASAWLISRMGGRITGPLRDSPFGVLVHATDPEGAPIALLQPH
ncbi:VOC family protein [Streptomyces sp. ACA25]|uniref:VOC family protein n=1 Tax=Streptomyces sp. ACA25 TaxID=3022596 RepID=UPI0023081588|nr:VOC family protein [Streptomyces sp. ACA25]MDB1088806.1 VOC family protein [Streptomyces sp. ACA25]